MKTSRCTTSPPPGRPAQDDAAPVHPAGSLRPHLRGLPATVLRPRQRRDVAQPPTGEAPREASRERPRNASVAPAGPAASWADIPDFLRDEIARHLRPADRMQLSRVARREHAEMVRASARFNADRATINAVRGNLLAAMAVIRGVATAPVQDTLAAFWHAGRTLDHDTLIRATRMLASAPDAARGEAAFDAMVAGMGDHADLFFARIDALTSAARRQGPGEDAQDGHDDTDAPG